MQTFTNTPTSYRTHHEPLSRRSCRGSVNGLLFLLLAASVMLSACGGGTSSRSSQTPLTLSGNWQFTMASPVDGSFVGGLQGGFMLQSNTAVKGAVAYSVALPANPNPTVCNSGSAAVTGTITDQAVGLTASAGTQTFTFTGTLSLDGSTMGGTYSSTAGTAPDGTPCGTAQTGLQWNAVLVPTLTGSIKGTFHSTGGSAGLTEQDFLVSGALTQGNNTGADTAAVTGNLSFLNALTNLSDYPCFTTAAVQGQISGNTVVLQLVGGDGSNLGQIGQSSGTGIQAVTFDLLQNAYALQSLAGAGYAVTTNACPAVSPAPYGDEGNICLALNSATACQQPITLTPSALTFSPQTIGSPATTQLITMANTYGSTLGGLTLALTSNAAGNFTETDTCGIDGAPSGGQPFALNAQQSCVVTIAFTPLVNCAPGVEPAQCLAVALTVASPNNDAIFTVPITGGVNSDAASATGFNLGMEHVLEARLPRALRFAYQNGDAIRSEPNSSAQPVQDEEGHAEID